MKQSIQPNYYEPTFVEELFDEMSGSYARMNYITSFGFSERWRQQSVKTFDIKEGDTVVDLMTGMGECWKYIFKKAKKPINLIALDFSSEMIQYAKRKVPKHPNQDITILKENVFQNAIKSNSADFITSGFGLKTFNSEQLYQLAQEIDRILKIGGQFSLIDVSVPSNSFLKAFYMFYLKRVIPILGWLFLGNPDNYKMLGIYTEAFDNAKEVAEIFKSYNFEVQYQSYFFGCASGVTGKKVIDSTQK